MYLKGLILINNTKEYVNAMNQMNEKLNESDRLYFNNLREYMQTRIFLKDEDSINKQIYQMYLDFMSAKDDGFSAEEFFGNNPKEMADQILDELPKASPLNISKYVGIFALVLWGIRLFFNFSENIHITINPVIYLFDLVLILSLVIILFKIISKNIYREPRISDMNTIAMSMIVITLILIAIVLYFSVPPLVPSTFEINIPYPWDIGVIIGYMIIAIIVMIKLSFKDFSYTLLMLIALFFTGIELRIAFFTNLSIPLWPQYLIRFGFVLTFFLIRRINRKDE